MAEKPSSDLASGAYNHRGVLYCDFRRRLSLQEVWLRPFEVEDHLQNPQLDSHLFELCVVGVDGGAVVPNLVPPRVVLCDL